MKFHHCWRPWKNAFGHNRDHREQGGQPVRDQKPYCVTAKNNMIHTGTHEHHHRCRSRYIFGCEKDFCPNFPKRARKIFCETFDYKFSPTRIMKYLYWCDLRIKVFMCFSANVGRQFLKPSNVGHHFLHGCLGNFPIFFRDFPHKCQGFCPDFQPIKTFGSACTPCTPAFCTTELQPICACTSHKAVAGTLPRNACVSRTPIFKVNNLYKILRLYTNTCGIYVRAVWN